MGGGDIDPQVGQAALESASLSKEHLAFIQDVYKNDQRPILAEQAAAAREASKLGLEVANEQRVNSREDREFLVNNIRPVEADLARSVREMNTEEYGNRKAGEAAATVETNFATAQDQGRRNLARQGVTANSAQLAALELNSPLLKAGMVAQASNAAREAAETQKYARQISLTQVARGISADGSTAAQISGSAGANSVNTSGAALNGMSSAASGVGAGFQSAAQGQNQLAGLLGQQQNARNASQAADNQAAGSAIGTIAMMAMM